MSSAVVDTNVVSLILKQHPEAQPYIEYLRDKEAVLCFMSLAELKRWPLAKNWGERKRAQLEAHLEEYTFSFCDEDLCDQWAEVRQQAHRNGRPIDVADAWIAATALHLNLPLATHNPRHFVGVDELDIVTYP